jgi:hypothetical protein
MSELDKLVQSIRAHRGLDLKNIEMQWAPKSKAKLHQLLSQGVKQSKLYIGKDGLYHIKIKQKRRRTIQQRQQKRRRTTRRVSS